MNWSDPELEKIYDRTNGKCHLCGSKRSFQNYGQHGERGAWSVDHSRPQARGGSDHMNNLFVACTSCNSEKGASSTRAARAGNELTRAPLSREAREDAKQKSAGAGALVGWGLGALLSLTPAGIVLSIVAGGALGYAKDPEAKDDITWF